MKLTVFQADKGDCLLLTGPAGERMLVDGGVARSYRRHVAPALARLARSRQALDLVYVSHIDQDHIGGVLKMMDDAVEWRRFDFQRRQGNRTFPQPKVPRPPVVKAVWHNGFKDQVDDNSGAIEDQLVASMKLANLRPGLIDPKLSAQAPVYDNLVASVREGLLLGVRLGRNQLNVPLNPEFGGKVICRDDGQPQAIALGGLTLRVLGPAKSDLDKLRQEWNKWLAGHQAALAKIRAEAKEEAATLPLTEGQLVLSSLLALASELGRRELVTVPNLASLMLLVEGGGKQILLTGDGHADDILAGLKANGLLDADGRLHVDVLKVQHHGSEHNLHQAFCESVTAEHYIFCGNGAHKNPDLDVMQLLIDTRLRAAGGRPFKLWFNSSVKVTEPANREHMRLLEQLVRQAARRSRRQLKYQFLTRGSLITVNF